MRKIFKPKKTKRRILALIILLLVLAFSLGAWSLSNHLVSKNRKTAQETDNQSQQSSDTPNPTIQGTEISSSQTETVNKTEKNNSGKQGLQQPNIAANPPAESSNPSPSPTPNYDERCQLYKQQQKQLLEISYQNYLNEAKFNYDQEVRDINTKYQSGYGGGIGSEQYYNDLRLAEMKYNIWLNEGVSWYQRRLLEIEGSC